MSVRIVTALLIAGGALFGLLVIGHASPLGLPAPIPPGADTLGPALKYETDQRVYKRGDVVHITVTNVSDVATPIVDRATVDGAFAVLEIKTDQGEWRPIKLSTGGTLVSFRDLAPGAQYEYFWPTSGREEPDEPPDPGTYRIGFGRPFYTNPFEIADK